MDIGSSSLNAIDVDKWVQEEEDDLDLGDPEWETHQGGCAALVECARAGTHAKSSISGGALSSAYGTSRARRVTAGGNVMNDSALASGESPSPILRVDSLDTLTASGSSSTIDKDGSETTLVSGLERRRGTDNREVSQGSSRRGSSPLYDLIDWGNVDDCSIACLFADENVLADVVQDIAPSSSIEVASAEDTTGQRPSSSRKREREVESNGDSGPEHPDVNKRARYTVDDLVLITQASYHWQVILETLPLGVQWQLAVIMSRSHMSYDLLELEWLKQLRYPSDARDKSDANANFAPKTVKFILEKLKKRDDESKQAEKKDRKTRQPDDAPLFEGAFAKEMSAKAPWAALDEEEKMLKTACRGTTGEPFNGKIWFMAKYTEKQFELHAPILGPSCRFTRKFGSSSMMRVKVGDKVRKDANAELFSRPHVINGRVWRAFYEKEGTVFMWRTNEMYDVRRNKICVDERDPWSLQAFIDWHNPMKLNQNQTLGKWAARTALGLSSSLPGPRLAPHQIHRDIGDKLSPHWLAFQKSHPEVKKPPSWMDMTDGCGFINRAGLRELQKQIGWDSLPTAVQVRFMGAKGLFLLHPGDDENNLKECHVWIRPSQEKIKYEESSLDDFALATIDILKPARLKTPSGFSTEVIINLAVNGVDPDVLISLLASSMDNTVMPLMDWGGEDGLIKLWHNVGRTNRVFGDRRSRIIAGDARARGYSSKDFEVDMDDEDGGDGDGIVSIMNELDERSSAWWPDDISGCPSTIAETVMEFLSSGFSPSTCITLRKKLLEVIKTLIKMKKKFRIDVPMSSRALIVPDPFGVLKPNEVQIKSSKRDLVMPSPDGGEMFTDIIIGDVLVTRNPCKLPTDVKKVTAVMYPQLKDYVDVIVFPVTGYRHLASELAGGDYDGDEVLEIHDPRIVSSFSNADEKYLEEPAAVVEFVLEDRTTVADFLKCHKETVTAKDPTSFVREQQRLLLANIGSDSLTGRCSSIHDHVLYMEGYTSPEAICFAYLFCTSLDGPKSGKSIKRSVLDERSKDFMIHGTPEWTLAGKDKDVTHVHFAKCNKAKYPKGFVMDKLVTAAQDAADRYLKEAYALLSNDKAQNPVDKALTKPWDDACRSADQDSNSTLRELKKKDLKLVENHVRSVFEKRQQRLGPERNQSFTDKHIVARQDIIRELSREFASYPSLNDMAYHHTDEDFLQRLKASCAYKLYHTPRTYSQYPFDVAFRVLCDIKAKASGCNKTLHRDFAAHHWMHKGFLKK